MTTISDERLAEMLAELVRDLDKAARNETIVRRYHVTAAEKALAALRAQGGVRVKPLEWHRSEIIGWNGDWHTVPTAYSIRCADENGWKWSGFGGFGYERSDESAKAAAQADYERRILGALEASPAPVSGEMVDVVAKAISRLIPLDGSSKWNEPFGHDFPTGYSKNERQMIRQIAAAALAAKGGQ